MSDIMSDDSYKSEDSEISEDEENEDLKENKSYSYNIMYYTSNNNKGSSCGYCKGSGCSFKYGSYAINISCQVYQDMIDMGWRRSGKYCYKPILDKSCCPQNTIRLRSLEYKVSKSHKKVLKRMEKYMTKSPDGSELVNKPEFPTVNSPETLVEWFKYAEHYKPFGKQRLRITICKSHVEKPTFNLYKKYQINIHNDDPERIKEEGFKRFLVDTPLIYEKNRSHYSYGSYHQKYYLDDKLIAVGVIDILPKCVSSVYFMYDTDYSSLSLGVFSALQEISLSVRLNKYLKSLKYYYLGFYIHSCSKMRYKAQYSPSDLLDPEYYCWIPIEHCIKLFEEKKLNDAKNPDPLIKHTCYVPFIRKMKEQNHKWIKQQKLITCPFDIPEIIEDKDLLQMLIVKGNKLMRYNVNYRIFFIFSFNIYLYIYLFIYF
jgi:arginine-tRNA-protein transferase